MRELFSLMEELLEICGFKCVSLTTLRHRAVQPVWFEDRLWMGIDKLPPKYRRLVEMRYGLAGNGVHTLREIGEVFSLTRERVRQLEERSLFLLRRYALERITIPKLEAPLISPHVDRIIQPQQMIAPAGLCAKLRSDYIRRQIAKITVAVRDRNLSKHYRVMLDRYEFAATNERKLLYRSGIWAAYGKNYWIFFDAKTAVLRIGYDPSQLRTTLFQLLG